MTAKQWLLLLLLAISLVALAQWSTVLVPKNNGADSDGVRYLAMAGDTTWPEIESRIAPFCYRVATPYLVQYMPAERPLEQFRQMAFLDGLLILLLTFGLLKALGFEFSWAMVGMVLYGGTFWALKFTVYSPAYIDHQTQVMWLLLLWVMARGWWWLLPVVLFGAMFQKESILAVVPIVLSYYLWQRGWRWWPLYVLGVLMVVAGLVPMYLLKQHVHPVNAQDTPFVAMERAWEFAVTTQGWARIMVVATLSGLGILPLLLLFRFRWLSGYLRREPYWLVMLVVGIVLLFGGRDKARLFIYMLPGIVAMSVGVLRNMSSWMPRLQFGIWLGVCLGLQFYIGGWANDLSDFEGYLNSVVPEYSPSGGSVGFAKGLLALGVLLLANYVLVRPYVGDRGNENQGEGARQE